MCWGRKEVVRLGVGWEVFYGRNVLVLFLIGRIFILELFYFEV